MKHSENQIKTAMQHLGLKNFVVIMKDGKIYKNTIK